MNKIFIRRKTDGSIRGPIEIDFAFEQLKQQQSFQAYQISEDQSQWHEAQDFFQMYMQQILKETRRLSMSQKISATRVGKYLIKSELGRGGMGVVYLAYDPEFDRKCAIKVLLNSENVRANKRFLVEARAMARFQHDNIAKIYDIQEHPKRYFVMEYIEGCTLKDTLENYRLSLKQKLEIFCQICNGVAYAHRNKIIHRDLKPINILLDKNNVPKILDFGIAKQMSNETEITKTGEVIGTPKYLAPEVIKGDKASYKSDLYSLAVVLYEILTGNSPFQGDSPLEIMYAISTQSPSAPSEVNEKVPVELDLLCMKCLDKDPEYRLESVAFLRKEIERFLNNKPILTKKFSYIYRAKKWMLRNPYQTTFGIFLLAISVVLYIALDYSNTKLKIAKEEHRKARLEHKNANQKYENANRKLIEARFEAVGNFIEKSNFYDAYHKLGEIYNDQQDFSSKKHIKKANFLLKYSVLPSLPHVQVYTNNSGNHLAFSPQGLYLYNVKDNYLLLWKNFTQDKPITEENCWLKIPVKNGITIQFTGSARHLAISNSECIDIYDIPIKKKIFSLSGQQQIEHVQISNNGKYIAFSKLATAKKKSFVLCDIISKKMRILNTHKPWNLLFSPNSKWLVYIGVDGKSTAKYQYTVVNVENNQFIKEATHSTPNMKFSTNSDILYLNNRKVVNLTQDTPKMIMSSAKIAKRTETDKDYLVLENTRIYEQSVGGIVKYNELNNTQTQFRLNIPKVRFDFSQTFLVAKAQKSVALWSTDSSELCYYYRDEQKPNLDFIPQSHVFYMNFANHLNVYRLFRGLKNIDFLEKTTKHRDKTLRIQFGKNREHFVVIDSSNTVLKQLKTQVKNKQSFLFSSLNLYNEHPAISNESFIAMLVKGCLAIYDRKNNKRFFFIDPASKFITAGIHENKVYYMRRYHLGILLGKIDLQQLTMNNAGSIVGREKNLKEDGYTKSQLLFHQDKIISHRKHSLVIFDKNLQKQNEIAMTGIQDYATDHHRIFIAHEDSVHIYKIIDGSIQKAATSKVNARFVRQIAIHPKGDYIAIANNGGQNILLGQIKNDEIVNLKKIHDGNNRHLLFHPSKPLLALFDREKITVHHCEEGYSSEYRKGLAMGRIVTFDSKWETLVTEMPNSIGLNLFPMRIKQEDYQDFINKYNIPTQEIFDH